MGRLLGTASETNPDADPARHPRPPSRPRLSCLSLRRVDKSHRCSRCGPSVSRPWPWCALGGRMVRCASRSCGNPPWGRRAVRRVARFGLLGAPAGFPVRSASLACAVRRVVPVGACVWRFVQWRWRRGRAACLAPSRRRFCVSAVAPVHGALADVRQDRHPKRKACACAVVLVSYRSYE